MERFTVLQDDFDAMDEAGLDEYSKAMVIYGMVRYGIKGVEPVFAPKGDSTDDMMQCAMARAVFGMIKKRIDNYIRKATNAKGKDRNGTNDAEAEPAEAKGNETAPAETNKNEQDKCGIEKNRNESKKTETHQDKDKDKEQGKGYGEDTDTHTENPQQGRNGRARARPGWFDPERPLGEDDRAWRFSPEARKATAQRMINYATKKMQEQFTVTEAGTLGTELFETLTAAMGAGIPPEECMSLAQGCGRTWQWELAVKEALIERGGAAGHPEWLDQVAEARREIS
jgi:hypothetical protein